MSRQWHLARERSIRQALYRPPSWFPGVVSPRGLATEGAGLAGTAVAKITLTQRRRRQRPGPLSRTSRGGPFRRLTPPAPDGRPHRLRYVNSGVPGRADCSRQQRRRLAGRAVLLSQMGIVLQTTVSEQQVPLICSWLVGMALWSRLDIQHLA
jgi:hypothetical protein